MTFAALSHPSLQDCRRMFLRNYEVQINIGVHEFEKKGEQRVLVNIDLFVSLAETTPQADRLEEVVDYDFMRNTVAARMAQGHIHLQETLCDDVARDPLGCSDGLRGLEFVDVPLPVAEAQRVTVEALALGHRQHRCGVKTTTQ